jgi:hypothetical protein
MARQLLWPVDELRLTTLTASVDSDEHNGTDYSQTENRGALSYRA